MDDLLSTPPQDAASHFRFGVEGMTCASCVGRVERAPDARSQPLTRRAAVAADFQHREDHHHVGLGDGGVEALVARLGRDVLELRPEQRCGCSLQAEDPLDLRLVLQGERELRRAGVKGPNQGNRPCHQPFVPCSKPVRKAAADGLHQIPGYPA